MAEKILKLLDTIYQLLFYKYNNENINFEVLFDNKS
jgi:hypothetical protein